jgi:hypothetical protein
MSTTEPDADFHNGQFTMAKDSGFFREDLQD